MCSATIAILRGEGINVTASDSDITVAADQINGKSIANILTTYDFGPVNGDFGNTVHFTLANANIEFGTIGIPSNINLDCGLIFES